MPPTSRHAALAVSPGRNRTKSLSVSRSGSEPNVSSNSAATGGSITTSHSPASDTKTGVKIAKLVPTRGLLNLPLYPWKDLFTTNYDNLIESAYSRNHKPIKVFSSNFDFEDDDTAIGTNLFKIHGTLDIDRSLGKNASIIITSEDYDRSSEYRELLFDRLLHETSRNDVVIIGHSLADTDINYVLNEAIRRKRDSGASGKLYALIYSPDQNRATLVERRGFQVCFGGLDDFFAELHNAGPNKILIHTDLGMCLIARRH